MGISWVVCQIETHDSHYLGSWLKFGFDLEYLVNISLCYMKVVGSNGTGYPRFIRVLLSILVNLRCSSSIVDSFGVFRVSRSPY